MAELPKLLQYLVESQGCDLFVKVGSAPHVRIDRELHAAPFPPIEPPDTEALTVEVLAPARRDELEATGQVDFALSVSGLGRFRVHIYRQRGSLALVFRRVMAGIPSWSRLGLPPIVDRLTAEGGGLVIVTGPAGSGKTTTVNALIDHVNETRAAYIVTIEDPVEFLHADKRSIISQLEVGTDTNDAAEAVRRVMRQGPDVLFLSELCDRDTVEAALATATTGHLVLTTMPTATTADTIVRLIDYFPPHEQVQARHALANGLRAVLSQRLLDRADGRGQTAAVEVLVNTAKVHECIVDPERAAALDRIVAEGEYYGMQSFDHALFGLFKDGMVSLRDALSVATEPEDLRIQLQRAGLVSV